MVNYNRTLVLHGYEDIKPQNFGVTILTFGVTWRHLLRDHRACNMQFPIGGQL